MARSDRSPLALASCFAALRTTLEQAPGLSRRPQSETMLQQQTGRVVSRPK